MNVEVSQECERKTEGDVRFKLERTDPLPEPFPP